MYFLREARILNVVIPGWTVDVALWEGKGKRINIKSSLQLCPQTHRTLRFPINPHASSLQVSPTDPHASPLTSKSVLVPPLQILFNKNASHHWTIVGSSSGMGFAVANLALAEKANVTIASSNRENVDAAVNRLKADSPSGQVAGYTFD